MNTLTTFPNMGEQTMSSREIAELTGKRHDHVMRDTREMLAELHGAEAAPKFGGSYLGKDGTTRPCFNLPKRETLILVSGYNLSMRARIIDRWQELEAAHQVDPMQALNDPATMRNLLLTYSEKMMELENANAALAPKAEALDRLTQASGSLCISDAAKALQMPPRRLFTKLSELGWIYRRHGTGWLGYQEKVRAGYLEHKVTTIDTAFGDPKISEQVRVTAKGLTKLGELGVTA